MKKEKESLNIEEEQAVLYKDCHELMLDRFIDICVDEKLDLLTVSGNPSPELLKETWEKIHAEYLFLCDNKQSDESDKIVLDISLWSIKFMRIETVLMRMQDMYIPFFANELRSMGYSVQEDLSDHEGYIKSLQAIYDQSKKWIVKINKRKKDLEDLQKKHSSANKENKKITRVDFYMMIASLSEHVGYQIIPREISTAMFAVMYKRASDYSKAQQKAIEKSKKQAKR